MADDDDLFDQGGVRPEHFNAPLRFTGRGGGDEAGGGMAQRGPFLEPFPPAPEKWIEVERGNKGKRAAPQLSELDRDSYMVIADFPSSLGDLWVKYKRNPEHDKWVDDRRAQFEKLQREDIARGDAPPFPTRRLVRTPNIVVNPVDAQEEDRAGLPYSEPGVDERLDINLPGRRMDWTQETPAFRRWMQDHLTREKQLDDAPTAANRDLGSRMIADARESQNIEDRRGESRGKVLAEWWRDKPWKKPWRDSYFDPESPGYDYRSADVFGIEPDKSGHYPSRAELPKEMTDELKLPEGSGVILKGRKHATWDKTIAGEKDAGYRVIRYKDRYYSIPEEAELPQGAKELD